MAFNNYLEDENDKPYFTTNSLAYYYDKMEGFAKAVEGAAKTLNLTKDEIEQRIALRLSEWDKNLESFDGSVEKLLTEWVDDGTLTHVIDSTLIDQRIAPVVLQLEDKANEDEVRKKAYLISSNDITEEFRQQIVGDTPINAVVSDNTIAPRKMFNGQLGANLLDLNDLTLNFYVDTTTGDLAGGSSYSVSNFTPIKPSTFYGVYGTARVAFYDSTKTFISGMQSRTFTTPVNATYIRVSLVNSTLEQHYLIEGTENIPLSKVPFSVKIPWIRIEKEDIFSLPEIPMKNIEGVIPSSNLYSKIRSKDGFYLDTLIPNQGREAVNATYTISDFIPVESGVVYSFYKVRHYVFYDRYKIAIAAAQIDTESLTVTTPARTAYVRLSIVLTNKDTAMFVKGNAIPTSYIPYGGDLSWYTPPKSKYSKKTVVNFGDSITASIDNLSLNNYGAYIAQDTGMIALNQGYSSGRMGYNAGGGRNPFSMYKLADAIATGNFTEQDSGLATLDASNVSEYTAQLAKLKAINFNTVDFITLAFGTNDWYGSISPVDNATDPYDVNNYYGATRYVIKTLQAKFPHLKFLLLTPIFRFNVPTPSDKVITEYSDTWKVNGYTLIDMASALKDVGKEMNVPVVDMYHELGINKHNCVYWFESLSSGIYDGTHPNVRTKELMGRKVAGTLLSTY